MPTSKATLNVKQGSDYACGWSVTYNGVPIDNTWAAKGQIRRPNMTPILYHELAVEVDSEGNVVLAISGEESSGWTWRHGVYDIEVTKADGSVRFPVAEGDVIVKAEVTK